MVVLIYLVAGMSSRFGGNVKQMAKVGPNGESLIEYSVKQALHNKFSKIIFITNRKTEHLFREIFGDVYDGVDVMYVEQIYDVNERTRPWGTTDAICSISGLFDEPFIMVNGDDLYGTNTFKLGYDMVHDSHDNFIGCVKMNKLIPEDGKNVNRGVIFVKNGKVTEMKEMLNININNCPEILAEYGNVNFICLQPNILRFLNKLLDNFKKDNIGNNSIECLLPDSLNTLIQNNLLDMKFFEITDEILGITHPGDEIGIAKILSK